MTKIKLIFSNEQKKKKAGFALRRLIRRAVRETLRYERLDERCAVPVTVSVTFTDNEKIRRMNREFRGLDRATDVLSFPLYDFAGGEQIPTDEPLALGDIVLSLERAEEQAREFGHSFERETAFLTVHSVLHLLGYDHLRSEKDDLDMRKRQREIMERLGLCPRPC